MLAKICIDAGLDPTVLVGATTPDLKGNNYRVGASDFFIVEACEYRRGFLHIQPAMVIVTTIDFDHYDTYPTKKSYRTVFKKLFQKLGPKGYLIAPAAESTAQFDVPKKNLILWNTGKKRAQFSYRDGAIVERHRRSDKLQLRVPGEHNIRNALAAYAGARTLGISSKSALKSLKTFSGTSRRLEYKGNKNGVLLYDDYAHHPVEIAATLQGIFSIHPRKKICVVYQPHQYSRTRIFLKEFGNAFKKVNTVIVPNIYEARDTLKDKKSVSVKKLVDVLKSSGIAAIDGRGLAKTKHYLKKNYRSFDIVITMGAGDVWKALAF
ncbi:MAG: UDP-N-acetylmuramate-L-alanine ligase [Candidatus Peregrinibacteria bacterium GW2011_GWA2_47_7]|nr:MAG: UDP-N-acetylmuramate-L-alanine ligase [Candidatus Peregrinibacteria bacterium GW2011_GWA2_47_7]